jgi:Tfp pilus assembly protein PilX
MKRALHRLPPHHAQDGIVLIIALVVMVAMSLAALGLVRSVDTTTAVVGNLALRQAAVLPANLAIEAASAALFKDASPSGAADIVDKTAHLPAQNYFASLQSGADPRGVPALLQTSAAADALARALYANSDWNHTPSNADEQFKVRYVIERMCRAPGPATSSNCEMMPPKQSPGTTVGDAAQPVLAQIPFYRVTVRVDGPRNTTTFLQAMLR